MDVRVEAAALNAAAWINPPILIIENPSEISVATINASTLTTFLVIPGNLGSNAPPKLTGIAI